jgi:hypothetical protein
MTRAEKPPHAPARLADALGLLQADADRRDHLQKAAQRTIAARFTVERNAREVVTLLQRGGEGRCVRWWTA